MVKSIKPPKDKEAEQAEEAKVSEEQKKAAEDAKAAEEAEKAAAAAQDEFQARGFELVEWVHDNRPIVLGFIGAVILGGIGFGVYQANQKSNNTAASAAYAAAQKIWEAPVGSDAAAEDDAPSFKDAAEKNKAAREAFQKVLDGHKGTGAATLAALSIGNAALKLGDFDGAATAYSRFLSEAKINDSMRFAGYAGLAAALDGKGDVKGAIKALEERVALPTKADKDGALLTLGSLYAKDGDADKARASFEQLLKDFPESSLKARAEEQLGALGVKPEAKKDDAKKDETK